MNDYEQKDWHNDVEFFIAQPKKEWRERLRIFLQKLFNCSDFTINQGKQISELLDISTIDFPGIMWNGGQIFQEKFERVHGRFNRLNWLFGALSDVAKWEFILQWLQSPNLELNGKPLDFLSDDESFKKLQEVIFRLASGTPS